MKYLSYFWVLFILYFIIAHPAIIYYAGDTGSHPERQHPVAAMIYLVTALVGWSVFFILSGRLIYKYTFGLKKGLAYLAKYGRLIEGKVVEVRSEKERSQGFMEKEILVAFNNLSDTHVKCSIFVTDTQPLLNRYSHGARIMLRVDEYVKYPPYVIADGVKTKVKPGKIIMMHTVWLAAIAGVAWYFQYAYTTESMGMGWRFLTWIHPLILSLIMLWAFILVGYFIFFRLIFSATGGSQKGAAARLMLYGVRTTADVTNAVQTGTYVNDQPQIKFELKFKDLNNTEHRVPLKKIVPLISLSEVHQSHRTIFYLPDSPSTIAFEEDL